MGERIARKLFAVAALAVLLCGARKPDQPLMTNEQTDGILAELKQIRELLERRQPKPAVRIRLIPGYPRLGLPDAPVTLLELTDLQCAPCRQFHQQVFPKIRNTYVESGKVRFYSYDLPLTTHPDALTAAVAARCAGDQGQFWPMRHVLFEAASPGTLQLDQAVFDKCRTSGKFDASIKEQRDIASTAGITGAPSFVIGKSTGPAVEGLLLKGAQPFSTFDSLIKQLLAQ